MTIYPAIVTNERDEFGTYIRITVLTLSEAVSLRDGLTSIIAALGDSVTEETK